MSVVLYEETNKLGLGKFALIEGVEDDVDSAAARCCEILPTALAKGQISSKL